MAAQMIYLGDAELKRLGADFAGIGRSYARLVAAFFTDGKDHPTWASTSIGASDTATAGVMVRIVNKNEELTLKGTVAVDVAAAAGPRLSASLVAGRDQVNLSRRSQSFRAARQSTITTLVHELRHVQKSWELELSLPTQVAPRRYAQRLYAQAFARDGYANAFERDAFAYAASWIEANRARVDKGAFDDLLPLDMIRRYAPG